MEHSASYRHDIEGLRGVAILAVVLFHSGVSGVSGGFLGVDVFFVLSGYLITGLLVSESREASRIDLPRFYARRVRRLLPAASLVVLATLAFCAAVMAPGELASTAHAGRASAVYVANYYFGLNAQNYFGPNVRLNPLLHMWSLAVEEQFYVLWPAIIAFTARRSATRAAVPWILAALGATCLILGALHRLGDSTFAFYGLAGRVPEFAAGGLAATIPAAWADRHARAWQALGWCGLLAITWAVHSTPALNGFYSRGMLAAVLGSVLILRAGANTSAVAWSPLQARPLQILGRLSYSWYLWHWPFLVLGAVLLPGIGVPGRLFAATAALLAAAWTHHAFENPIRWNSWLAERPKRSLGLGLALTILALAAAFGAGRLADRLARRPDMRALSEASGEIADFPRATCVTTGTSSAMKECSFGEGSALTIVIFGDSHALQFFTPLHALAQARGWTLVTFFKSGCPAVDLAPSPTIGSAACATWRHSSLSRIADLHPGLIIVASWTGPLVGTSANEGGAVTLEEWSTGIHRTISSLSRSRSPVLWIHDNPMPGFDVPACLARAARNAWYPGRRCSPLRASAINPALLAVEQRAVSSSAGVSLLSFDEMICPAERCPVVRDGAVVFRDSDHLTRRFTATLAPRLERAIDAAIAKAAPAAGRN